MKKSVKSCLPCNRLLRRRVRLAVEHLEDRTVPATIHWNIDTDGFWNVPGNWDLNRVPNSNDDVIIDRGAANPTVTVRDTEYAHSVTNTEKLSVTGGDFHPAYGGNTVLGGNLELNGGNLVNDGTLRITGDVNWYSGITVGTVVFAGTTHISGPMDKGSYRSLIANEGLMIQDGTGNFAVVDVVGYAIENRASGVYEIQGDNTFEGMSFTNYGTVRKTEGSGEAVIGVLYGTFQMKAGSTVESLSGKLTLNSRNNEGGTINAAVGAVVDVTHGNSTVWTGTYTGSGAGRVELAAGDISINNNDKAIFNFPQGLFQWTSGSISGGSLDNIGYLQISGIADKSSYRGGVINEGHIIWSGAGNVYYLQFDNRSAGLFEIQNDAKTINSVFLNSGILRKALGTGQSEIGSSGGWFTLQTGGTVEALSGKLILHSRDNEGGTINAAAGAVVDVTGSDSAVWTGTYTGSGAGRVELANGEIRIDNNNKAVFNFPQGLFQWTSGNISSGSLDNIGYLQISGDTDKSSYRGGLINEGHVIWSGTGNILYLEIDNLATGTLDIQGDAQTVNSYFINTGIVRKTGGTGESQIAASGGYFQLQAGGTIEGLSGKLTLHSYQNQGGTINAAVGAVVDLTGGDNTGAWTGTYTGSGAGIVQLSSGYIFSDNVNQVIFNFPQGLFHWIGGTLGGQTLLNTGYVQISGDGDKNTYSGGLVNQGIVIQTGLGNIVNAGGGLIVNQAGGLYDLQSDTNIGGTFANSGTFRKSVGIGQSNLGTIAANADGGTYEALSGTLVFPTTGLFKNATFNAAAGATILMNDRVTNGGVKTFSGMIQGHGLGHILLQSTMVTDGVTQGTLNFDQGLAIVGNDNYFSGDFIFKGFITFNSSTYLEWRGTFVNQGTIDLTGTSGLGLYTGGCTFDNQGTFNILNDSNIIANSGYGYQLLFTNEGSIRKIGGTGTSSMLSDGTSGPFLLTNTGTVEVLTGTLAIMSPTFSLPQFVSGKLTGGIWNVGPGATLTFPNASAITNNQGNIILTGPGANFTNIAGLTRNEGTLRVDQGKSFTTTGNFTNTGHLETGASSTFQANGTLTLTGTSTVHVDVTGSLASGQFGKIKSTGSATLAGTFDVGLQGYGPTASEQYPVISYASKTGNFAALTGLDPYFSAVVNPTGVILNGQGTPPDLTVIDVQPPAVGTVGQPIAINFTVKNLSDTAAHGTWQDAVYLSHDRVLSPEDKLVGTQQHSGDVAAGGTYLGTLNASLPGVQDGTYYLIVVSDAANNVADSDRSNNTSASVSSVAVQIASFGVSQPASGSLALQQPVYYRLTIPADRPDLLLQLQGVAGSNVELYAAQGRLPSTADFDLASSQFNSSLATILVSNPGLNTWYVMAIARKGSAPVSYTLSASQAMPSLSAVSPTKIGNSGQITLVLFGTQLRASDLYQIVAPNNAVFTAGIVSAVGTGQATATFQLNNAPLGQYTVQIVRQGQVITLADKITVEASKAAKFVPTLAMPGSYRAGQLFQAAVVYRNDGNVDIPAPVIILTGNANTKIAFNRQDLVGTHANSVGNGRVVLGIGKSNNPGVLRPGEEARIPFWVLESTGTGASVNVDYQTADSTDPIDWTSVSAQMRPAGLTDARWNSSFSLFQAAVGSTWGQYIQFLDRYVQKVKDQPEQLPPEAPYLLPNGVGTNSTKYYETVEILDYAFSELRAETGREVSGTIYLENNDHPLAGVLVRLGNDDNAVTAYTDANGVYRLPQLPNGTYSLSVDGYLLSAPVSLTLSGAVLNNQNITVSTGGVIDGHVQRSTDAALLGGLRVVAQGSSGQQFSIYTESNGTYRFTGLPTDYYVLSSSGAGLAVTSTPSFSVLNTDMLHNVDITLPLASIISGQVKANNAALAGATVLMRDAQSHSLSIVTDSQGTFSFNQLPAGVYTLIVSKASFATQSQSVTVGTGVEASVPTIYLAAGGTITLVIKNGQNQTLANASALIGQNNVPFQSALSDSQGQISFTDLAAGLYDLVITSDHYNPQTVTINVTTGMVSNQTITLSVAGIIQGNVKDADNLPIANMPVDFFTTDVHGTLRTFYAQTDDQGNYSLSLPYGNYGVSFGNNTGIYRQSVTLDANNLVDTVNMTMTGASLTGTVMQSDGVTPIANASVELRQAGGALATAITTSDGSYIFRGLTAGVYTLQADSKLGYTNRQTSNVIADTSNTTGNLVTGQLTYQGTIFGSNNLALEGASVGLFPVNAPTLGDETFQITLVDGHYQFTGLIAGNYLLRIEAPDQVTYEQTLAVNGSVNLDIHLTQGVSLQGTVQFMGMPVSNALVSVFSPNSLNAWGVATTNAQGQYTLENLPVGTFNIIVQSAHQQTRLIENVAISNNMPAFNISVLAQTTSLQGVVRDDAGQPLSLAIVRIFTASGDMVESLLTDQFGYYETTRLPAGQYDIKVQSLGYRGQELTGAQIDAGTPLAGNFTLVTAGTDEPPGFVETLTDAGAYVVAAPIRLIVDTFIKDTKAAVPKPERLGNDSGSLSELAIPGRDACSEKERLYLAALNAYFKKEAAYKDWNTLYEEFNHTFENAAGLFTFQVIDMSVSAYLAANSGAVKEAFLAAGNLSRLSYVALQAEQFAEAINKALDLPGLYSKIISGHGGFKDLTGLVDKLYGVISKSKSITDSLQRFIDVVNTGKVGSSASWSNAFSWVGVAIKLVKTVLETKSSLDTLNSLIDNSQFAHKDYLKKLTDYKSAKKQYDDFNCDDPKDTKPKPPQHGPHALIGVWRSTDPNQLQSTGVGEFGAIRPGEVISYTANFENLPTATAPAQVVKITLPLSSCLDWSTLQLTGVGFNDVNLSFGAGLKNYETIVTSASDPDHPVKVTISFDPITGQLVATMQSIDPLTGQATDDPAAGFLPPDDATGRGRGYLTFDILTKGNLAAGVEIKNQASIIFDTNAPLLTNQSLNTIDTEAPATKVGSLPATTTSTNFTVTWSGQDPHHGAGIATYNIYVSTNNGTYALWQNDTSDTSATFTGEKGKTYSFYSIASDGLGMTETAHTNADATIAVLANLTPSIDRVVLSNGDAQRSKVLYIQVYFNTLVTFDKGAFELYLNGKRFTISNILTTVQDGKTVATLQFLTTTLSHTSLPEGQYKLITRSKAVKAKTGSLKMVSDETDSFFRLYGDVNGDGVVDATDQAVFNTTYGKKAGQAGYLWFLDYDGNGKVDAKDLAVFNARLKAKK